MSNDQIFYFPRHNANTFFSHWRTKPTICASFSVRDGEAMDHLPDDIERIELLRVSEDFNFDGLARFQKLSDITFWHYGQLSDRSLAFLGELPNLRSLAFHGCSNEKPDFSPKAFAPLTRCHDLRALCIQGPSEAEGQWLTPRHLEPIGEISSLEVLFLQRHFSVKATALKKLRELRKLWYLDLSESKVGSGLSHLAHLPLRVLVLDASSGTETTRSTAITNKVLGELGSLTSLKSLSLRNCVKIKEDGLEQLTPLSNLQFIDLTYCRKFYSTPDALWPLMKFPNLQIANLDDVSYAPNAHPSPKEGFLPFIKSQSLRAVLLATFRKKDEHLHALADIESLRYLALDGHAANSTAKFSPAALRQLQQLERMDLKITTRRGGSGVTVADRGCLEALAELPLRSLRLHGETKELSAQDLSILSHSRTLKRLHIEDNDGVEVLKESMPKCHITSDLMDWESLDVQLPLAHWRE